MDAISYEAKLIKLAAVMNNRAMLAQLARKKNPEKLEYMLRKFNVAITEAPKPPVIKEPPPLRIVYKKEAKQPEVKPEKWAIIRNNHEIDYDDLPGYIQKLWDENRDNYKLIRSLHEKLKLMERAPDTAREPLTKEIVSRDERIKDNWKDIDSWYPGKENEGNPEVKPLAEMDHKRINSNRKYISKNLPKCNENSDKAAFFRENMQLRYNELKAAGIEMTSKTLAELTAVGIII